MPPSSDSILRIWEFWSRSEFRGGRFMIVDALGNAIVPEASIAGSAIRLARTADPLAHGDRAMLLNGRGMTIDVVVIELDDRRDRAAVR